MKVRIVQPSGLVQVDDLPPESFTLEWMQQQVGGPVEWLRPGWYTNQSFQRVFVNEEAKLTKEPLNQPATVMIGWRGSDMLRGPVVLFEDIPPGW